MNILHVVCGKGSYLKAFHQTKYYSILNIHVFGLKDCGAVEFAKEKGFKTAVYNPKKTSAWYCQIDNFAKENNIDLAILHIARLIKGPILNRMKNKIINSHPALLPDCKGMRGFEQSLEMDSDKLGSTTHFVDETMDGGPIIQQNWFDYDKGVPIVQLRHKLFVRECQSILQIIKWIDQKRIKVHGHDVVIKDAKLERNNFKPALDFEEAIEFPNNYSVIK